MANGSSRVLPAILFLAVGFAVAWFVKRPAPSPFAPRNGFLVRVYSDGKLSMDPVPISRTLGDQVAWSTGPSGESLEIVFHEKDFPPAPNNKPPFDETWMKHKNQDWIASCGGGGCFSGPINQKLDLAEGAKLEYKYDQIVGAKAADGMIIIRP